MPGVNPPPRAFQPGITSSADFTDSHRFFCVCIGVGFVFRLRESALSAYPLVGVNMNRFRLNDVAPWEARLCRSPPPIPNVAPGLMGFDRPKAATDWKQTE